LNNGPFLIYLTARDKGRGEAALKQLEQDSQLKIKYHHLDITDESSVKDLAKHLKETHTEGIDFVINNAGIALNGFGTAPRLHNIIHINTYRLQHCQRDPPHKLL
jgi:carbonyl reductase 1